MKYTSDMRGMRGITIKLPEATLRRLREEARATGRTLAAVVRDRLESSSAHTESFYSLTADLAGSLEGRPLSATNSRRKFRKP
jgi:hypothetical protein